MWKSHNLLAVLSEINQLAYFRCSYGSHVLSIRYEWIFSKKGKSYRYRFETSHNIMGDSDSGCISFWKMKSSGCFCNYCPHGKELYFQF